MWTFLRSHLDKEVCVVKGKGEMMEYMYFTLTNAHRCIAGTDKTVYRLKLMNPINPSKIVTMILHEYATGEMDMYDEDESYVFSRTPFALLP